jgi:hypothetical protein
MGSRVGFPPHANSVTRLDTLRRTLALLPLALAGLAIAVSATDDARANDTSPVSAPMAGRSTVHIAAHLSAAPPVRASFRATGPRKKWGSFQVAEGALPAVTAGAACPAGMANVDDRFCVDRWEASLVEVLPDGSEQSWPPFGAL